MRGALLGAVILTPFYFISDAGAHSPAAPASVRPRVAAAKPAGAGPIWLVESGAAYEVYSNGLRIEKRFGAAGRQRNWRPVPLNGGPAAAPRSSPAGIVFHSTESEQVPFDADYNHSLKRIGEETVDYVRGKRAYHFVIDRFGRVYGVVPENEVANHAGHSVWADAQWVYVNLNRSFLGISFEARTGGELAPALSPAQIHAGRMLTDMLRAKYAIAAENCVTHAQVSVNPSNMRLGYHTDWREDFPFAAMGLGDNYAQPPAAVYLFGFTLDASYECTRNAALRRALLESEERVRELAAERGSSVSAYRGILKRNYQKTLALSGGSPIEGVNHESNAQ